ncbi:MAG: hypothetical protein J5I65_00365 [Aridibacter famidurans]|nr:hypothetical protein [Aridibacter famidurans]
MFPTDYQSILAGVDDIDMEKRLEGGQILQPEMRKWRQETGDRRRNLQSFTMKA